jgi:hypothetical protein
MKSDYGWIRALGLERIGEVIELDRVKEHGDILIRAINEVDQELNLKCRKSEKDQEVKPVVL